ncbi:hypothetical protein Tco_0591917 [Tanacetum coccineum]
MASDGSDQEAEYALSKLLQMGTVEDYQRELEMLIKLVTNTESLLKSFYISGLKLDLQCLLLRSNPSTLGEDFFKARITEARFEIIAKEEKEHIIEKKIDVILPLQSEFASPKAKGSLNVDEYISVVEVVMGGGKAFGVYREKSHGATEGGRSVLCYVQRSGRLKKKRLEAAIQKRLWDPGIKSAF